MTPILQNSIRSLRLSQSMQLYVLATRKLASSGKTEKRVPPKANIRHSPFHAEKTRAEMNKPEPHNQESKDELHLYALIFYLTR
ncbi:MAG TPA: hypothetical protein VEL70_07930 [Candidatus Acidoferrum sp.]|nr:hypothetical protein [Candidatus Acidoferrum sp.]